MKTSYFSISPYFSSGAPVVRFCPVPPDLPESRAAAFGVRRGPAASADGSPAACGSAASGRDAGDRSPQRWMGWGPRWATAPLCHGENLKWFFIKVFWSKILRMVAICCHMLSWFKFKSQCLRVSCQIVRSTGQKLLRRKQIQFGIYIGAYMQSLTLNVDLLGRFPDRWGIPPSQPQVLNPGPSGWCCHRGLARLLVLGRSWKWLCRSVQLDLQGGNGISQGHNLSVALRYDDWISSLKNIPFFNFFVPWNSPGGQLYRIYQYVGTNQSQLSLMFLSLDCGKIRQKPWCSVSGETHVPPKS